MLSISVAVTTYMRFELTVKAIEQLLDDPRITDFQILDDKSTDGSFERLSERFYDTPKVYVRQQKVNRNMSLNKKDAIALAKSQYVAILDSDNTFDETFIDAIEAVGELSENTLYCPSFAKPAFNYEKFSGLWIVKGNAKEVIADAMGNCLFNTANYVVNKEFYLQTYEYNPEHIASDTIWHNYQHLKKGGRMYVVPNMTYSHLQHSGSGFMQDLQYNMDKAAEIRNKILQDQW